MTNRPQAAALRIASIYAILATVWVVGTDAMAHWAGASSFRGWGINSLKGLVFVVLSATMLFELMRRHLSRLHKAQAALRTSAQLVQGTLDSLSASVAIVDATGVILSVNRAWRTFARSNTSRPEAVEEGANYFTVIERAGAGAAEYAARMATGVRDVLAGRGAEFSFEYLCRSGPTPRWCAARVTRFEGAGDGRLVIVHEDITARKSAEAALLDRERRYRELFEDDPQPMWIFDQDSLNIVQVNRAATEHYGYSREEFLGMSLRDLRPPEELPRFEKSLREGLKDKQRAGTWRHWKKNRENILVELTSHSVQWEGRECRMVRAEDVTVRLKNKQELLLLRAAVMASPGGWIITDAHGTIEWVNPAFTHVTGYSFADAVGQNPRILKSGEHPPQFYAELWQTIRRGEVWRGEVRNRRKDGTFYHEEMTIAPVRGEGNAISHFVAIKRDISERKLLEQQIARTQRLDSIGLLASGIAHDLNNCLAPALLSIDLLKLEYPLAEAQPLLDTVETSMRRGAEIVGQILTFARGMDGERVSVLPRFLVKEISRLASETFPRNIQVQHEVATDVRPLMADGTQLHQVLLNLAVNARDAMPNGGTLRLTARNFDLNAFWQSRFPSLQPGRYVMFTVADTGSGIPPQVIDHIFEPFFTTKPRGQGTGLGLSTAYGIVRSHGGVIDVQTELGHGTEFSVLLPAAEAANPEPGPVDVAAGPVTGAGRCVLLVEDEAAIATVTRAVLERRGFTVVSATDGHDGVEKFSAQPGRFTLALLDVMMPRMDGLEAARRLRRIRPELPVILSSGLTSNPGAMNDTADYGGHGPHTVLRKPYDESGLLAALRAVLPERAVAGGATIHSPPSATSSVR